MLRSSVAYLLSSTAGPAVAFLLLPVLTRVLTPEDYGVLGLLAATSGALSAVMGLSPNLMITARFAVLSRTQLKELISASVPFTLLTVLGGWLVIEGINAVWGGSELSHWAVLMLVFATAAGVFYRLGLTLLQMMHRPLPHMLLEVGGALLTGLAALGLVLGMGLDWKGKFLADAVAAIALGVGAAVWLARVGLLGLRSSRSARREFLHYSAPLAGHSLAYWAINAQDRYFVTAMVGLAATGRYAVAYTLGNVVGLLHQGALRAFTPHFYELARQGPRERIQIVRFTYAYLTAALVGWGLFVLAAWFVVPLLLGPEFRSGFAFIPWVALGYTFNALRQLMAGYLYIADRTRLIGALTLSAAALNALLNFVLITLIGPLGAAVATAATFGLVAVLTAVFAVRSHPMPWRAALEVG